MKQKKEAVQQNIQVLVRCRPLGAREMSAGSCVTVHKSKKEIIVAQRIGGNGNTVSKAFQYDCVFDPFSTQEEVFDSSIQQIVEEVLSGYSCTIFAYGQTSTGKTYTMEGNRDAQGNVLDPGIIPRCIDYIYKVLKSKEVTDNTVKVTVLEVYREELFDLLSDEPVDQLTPGFGINADKVLKSKDLRIYEEEKRGCFVEGLEEANVENESHILAILKKAYHKRRVSETNMNDYSSRSHLITSITIHMREQTADGEELIKTGKLNLVDLAGSENLKKSGAQKTETSKINRSLLTLGRCIQALCTGQPHVPYRESKLTRLLQDSLGGHTKTCIIATISPSEIHAEETLNTLDYALKAKNIKNKPEVNQKISKTQMIKELAGDIEKLKRDLLMQREKSGVFISNDDYQDQLFKIQNLTAKTEQLETILGQKDEIEKQKDEEISKKAQQLSQKEQLLTSEVTEHKKTKQDLDTVHKQATQVLKDLEETETMGDGLQKKIVRQSQTDESNVQTVKEYCTNFEEASKNCEKEIKKFVHNQQTKIQVEFDSILSNFKNSNNQQFGAILNQLESLKNLMENNINQSQDSVSKFSNEKLSNFYQNLSNENSEFYTQLSKTCEFTGNKVCEIVERLKFLISNVVVSIDILSTQLQESTLNLSTKIVAPFLQKSKLLMNSWKDKQDSYFTQQKLTLEKERSMISFWKNEMLTQQQEDQKRIESLLLQIQEERTKRIQNFSNEFLGNLNLRESFEQTQDLFCQDSFAEVSSSNDQLDTEIEQHNSQFLFNFNSNFKIPNQSILLNEVPSLLQNDISKSISTQFFSASNSDSSTIFNQISNHKDKISNFVADQSKSSNEFVDSLKTMFESQKKSTSDMQTEQLAPILSATQENCDILVEDMKDLSKQSTNSSMDFANDTILDKFVNEGVKNTEKLNNKVRKYTPTGDTPKPATKKRRIMSLIPLNSNNNNVLATTMSPQRFVFQELDSNKFSEPSISLTPQKQVLSSKQTISKQVLKEDCCEGNKENNLFENETITATPEAKAAKLVRRSSFTTFNNK